MRQNVHSSGNLAHIRVGHSGPRVTAVTEAMSHCHTVPLCQLHRSCWLQCASSNTRQVTQEASAVPPNSGEMPPPIPGGKRSHWLWGEPLHIVQLYFFPLWKILIPRCLPLHCLPRDREYFEFWPKWASLSGHLYIFAAQRWERSNWLWGTHCMLLLCNFTSFTSEKDSNPASSQLDLDLDFDQD